MNTSEMAHLTDLADTVIDFLFYLWEKSDHPKAELCFFNKPYEYGLNLRGSSGERL